MDYPILSDEKKEVAKAYGILSARGFSGRVTFYIGKDGKILAIDKKVNARNAGADVAKKLGELGVAKAK